MVITQPAAKLANRVVSHRQIAPQHRRDSQPVAPLRQLTAIKPQAGAVGRGLVCQKAHCFTVRSFDHGQRAAKDIEFATAIQFQPPERCVTLGVEQGAALPHLIQFGNQR